MKRAPGIILFFILFFVLNSQAQSPLADTLHFNDLPDSLRKTIGNRLPLLMERDTVVGRFSYVKNKIMRIYTYKVYLTEGRLFGFYTYYRDCRDCITSHDLRFITGIALYCCKDPRHSPKETAKTRDEILAIKRRNGCAKVGICIY